MSETDLSNDKKPDAIITETRTVKNTSPASQNPILSQPSTNASSETWLNRHIASILALISVLLTFLMFWFFVDIANDPIKELRSLNLAKHELQISSEALSTAPTDAEKKKEVDVLKTKVINAQSEVDESKERRQMMKDFVLYILGVLSSILTTVFGYYFGSSKSSSNKDEAFQEMAKKGLVNNPPVG